MAQPKLFSLFEYVLRPTVNGIAHLPCSYGIALPSLEVIVRNRVIQKCVTHLDDQQLYYYLLQWENGWAKYIVGQLLFRMVEAISSLLFVELVLFCF